MVDGVYVLQPPAAMDSSDRLGTLRTTCRCQSSLTTWVLGIKFRSQSDHRYLYPLKQLWPLVFFISTDRKDWSLLYLPAILTTIPLPSVFGAFLPPQGMVVAPKFFKTSYRVEAIGLQHVHNRHCGWRLLARQIGLKLAFCELQAQDLFNGRTLRFRTPPRLVHRRSEDCLLRSLRWVHQT